MPVLAFTSPWIINDHKGAVMKVTWPIFGSVKLSTLNFVCKLSVSCSSFHIRNLSSKGIASVMWPILPHDAMYKCSLCCRPVSVCLSVTFVYCVQMAEDIVRLIYQPILVFWLWAPVPNFKVTLYLGCKIHGVGKICSFRLKSLFISERVRDKPILLWNFN